MNKRRLKLVLLLSTFCLLLISGVIQAKTKVTFWIDRDEISEFTEPTLFELVDEYNKKHKNIFIDLKNVMSSGSGATGTGSASSYNTKVMAALATNIGPDIWWNYDADMAPPIAAGYVDPAPSYVTENMKKNGIYEWVLQAMSMNTGKVYGVPHDVMWGAMLYNKKFFREAGLDPEEGPKTWDDFINYAIKLSKWDKNGKLIRAGYSVRFTGGLVGTADKWAHFLMCAGGQLLDESGEKAAFNSKAGIEALQLYVDLVHKYKVDALDFPRDIQAFAQGYIAMIAPREAFMIPWIREYARDLDLGVCYMPAKTRHASSGAVRMISVNQNSKVKEEAWAFLDWLNQPKQAKRMYVNNKQLPAYAPLAESPIYDGIEFKAWTTHPNVIARAESVKLGEIYPIIGRAVQSAVYQKQGVKEALDDAAAQVNKILSK
jgi:ABC-type glycerol-3-phosphate transport system substrate-binding protein